MSSKIHVVVEYGGPYYERWEHIVKAWSTLDAARAQIEHLKKYAGKNPEVVDALDAHVKTLPACAPFDETLLIVKPLVGDRKVTPEEGRERTQINAYNRGLRQGYHDIVVGAYDKMLRHERVKFLVANYDMSEEKADRFVRVVYEGEYYSKFKITEMELD